MKLVTAPFLLRVSRLARTSKLPQIPLLIVDRLRAPRTIHHRITKRPAVRRPNLAPVKEFLIAFDVTRCTRTQSARGRTKRCSLMFGVTRNTTNARYFVRLDHGRYKRFGVMTRGTALLH